MSANTFRVFVSSTFTDFRLEREALQREVFEPLQEYCLARGAHFQAIDLRVGISQEAALDQQTIPLCLREVERCREITPRPNFIVLLGDRYGWRPLPASIPSPEFQAICAVLDATEVARLRDWYAEDTNQLPDGAFVLKPRDPDGPYAEAEPWERRERELLAILERAVARLTLPSEALPKYRASATHQEIRTGALSGDHRSDHVYVFTRSITGLPDTVARGEYTDLARDADGNITNTTDTDAQARLAALRDDLLSRFAAAVADAGLRRNLDSLLDSDKLHDAAVARLRELITHRVPLQLLTEVDALAAKVALTADELGSVRAKLEALLATDIDEAMALLGRHSARVILQQPLLDLVADVDDEVRRRALEILATNEVDGELLLRLRSYLLGNIFHYDARWTGTGITTDHVAPLCDDVLASLTRIIDVELARLDEGSPIDREREAHEAFGRQRAAHFVGRTTDLQGIDTYLRSPGQHVMAIHGGSGTGKTALLARAAQLAIEADRGAHLVRFLGTTADSSSGRELVLSLAREIEALYGPITQLDSERGIDVAVPVPVDYDGLVRDFPNRLAQASAERPLFIFLDALDQLSDADGARDLYWLPSNLPPYVHIVVSTLPGESLEVLEQRPSIVQEVGPLEPEFGDELLAAWLTDVGRRLTPEQTGNIIARFSRTAEGSPLYLKLAFERARSWKSTDDPWAPGSDLALRDTVAGAIGALFDHLSDPTRHGAVLVAHALGYLAAAKNGLTEDELLELLSRDEEVMAPIREARDETDRRPGKPPLDRLPVVLWSRLYLDLEPYLSHRGDDGTTLMSFYHRQIREAANARYLTPADPPLPPDAPDSSVKVQRHRALATLFTRRGYESGPDGAKRPNLRTLSELPFQQTHGRLWDDVFETLTDFRFLELKAATGAFTHKEDGRDVTIYSGVFQLQEDYALALDHFPGARADRSKGGLPIVTAVDFHRPKRKPMHGVHVRCPHCAALVPVAEKDIGTLFRCTACKMEMKLNPFVAGKPEWDKR